MNTILIDDTYEIYIFGVKSIFRTFFSSIFKTRPGRISSVKLYSKKLLKRSCFFLSKVILMMSEPWKLDRVRLRSLLSRPEKWWFFSLRDPETDFSVEKFLSKVIYYCRNLNIANNIQSHQSGLVARIKWYHQSNFLLFLLLNIKVLN